MIGVSSDLSLPILVVNPGSTSTKIAIVQDRRMAVHGVLQHCSVERERVGGVWDQFEHRLQLCRDWADIHIDRCMAVVTLGGLFRPVEGGIYAVNDRMLVDARANIQGEHASNLGCAIAEVLSRHYRCPAFVVDPVSVDEFGPLARYSGHPRIPRRSLSHALSLHEAARRASEMVGVPHSDSAFVVAHLGGGISIAPVVGGKIIDANDAASDGPFSPERSGGLPLQPLISLCFSGELSEGEIRRLVMGGGGLKAYLGTNSIPDVEDRVRSGDLRAREILEAMSYQIAKEIGAMSTVLGGKLHGIVLTGGMARSDLIVSWVTERVRFLGPVIVFPEECELLALGLAASRVLSGEEDLKEY